MGRYLGSSVFAQLLLQMRSKDFSNPEDRQYSGVRDLGGVLIDSEISLEWQTPFFLLEWTLTPQYPEELFIRDNTFTFSWRYSYLGASNAYTPTGDYYGAGHPADGSFRSNRC